MCAVCTLVYVVCAVCAVCATGKYALRAVCCVRSAVYSHTDAILLLPLLLALLLPQVNTATRDAMVHALRQAGVQTGGCGAFSIRLRPSMVFGQEVSVILYKLYSVSASAPLWFSVRR